jgi:hypothetical protein
MIGGGHMALVNQSAGKITGDVTAALILNTGVNTIINAGTITANGAGGVEIKSEVANTGLLIATSGTLMLDKAVTGAGSARISGGTLFAAGAFSENVAFTGTAGELELARAQTYTGNVFGFSHDGTTSLDLRDIGFVSAAEATFSGTKAAGTLTVTDGIHTAKIKMVGNYMGVTFTASSDGKGGATVVDSINSAAVHNFVDAIAATGASSGSSLPPPHWTPPQALLTHEVAGGRWA